MARWSGPNIRRNLWYLYSATRLCPEYLPSPHCVSVTCAFFFRIVRAASKFKPISRLAQRLTTQIEIGHAAVSRASAARTARRIRPTMRKLTWRLTLALNGRPLGPEASGRREMNSAPAARRSETCHGPLERVVRRLFHRTCQPFPSNCTDAHAGPPSLARPKICASSSFDVFDITESIIDHVMCQSGTLARRSQHVATCPAPTPEFRYKNRRSGGPCTATPKRRGMALPASLATRTCVVNVILPLAVATGPSSASLPICSAHVTPAGGPSTTTRRVKNAGESIIATPGRGTAVISYSRLTRALSGRLTRYQACGRRTMAGAQDARPRGQ